MALKTGVPEQKMALETGYRNRKWLSNIGTGTKHGSQKWVPEQKVVIKYGYRNRKWSSNMGTGTC